MLKYIIMRILWMIAILLIILTIIYFTTSLVMMDIWIRPKIHFPDNFRIVYFRYIDYFKKVIFEWDWGKSEEGVSVWLIFKDKAPITLKINFFTLIGFTIIGSVLGFIQAITKDSFIDHFIGIFTMTFSSIPAIFLIFPLILLLGYRWELLPTQYPHHTDPIGEQYLGLIIPFLALAGYAIATLARIVRGEILDSLSSNYILLARTKGLTRKQAIVKHCLRNSIVSILPHLPSLFLGTLLSSILMEEVYGIRGLAAWYLDSMHRTIFDTGYYYIIIPNAVIISMFYVLIAVVFTLIVDLLYGLVDPRIKIYSKKV
ncbi:MAG: ABC transporter permease [Bacillota bacterium]